VHYFTQLGPPTDSPTCYSREIVRTVSSAFACTEDIFYIILYTLCYIAQASRWVHVFCMCSSMWHAFYVWCLFFYCYLMATSRDCVPYVQNPSMGTKMPVTCYIFIVLVHKLVTLQVLLTSSGKPSFQCEAYNKLLRSTQNDDIPLRLQHLFSAFDTIHSVSVGGKKSNLPRGSCIFLNWLAMNLLVFNGTVQDSVGWPPRVWMRISSHWYLLELRKSPS